MLSRLAPALAIAAVFAAGCGGGGDSGAEETVRDYFDAIRQMDGEAACAELTDELRQDIEETPAAASTGRSCGDLMQLALALNPALTQEDVDDLEIDVSEDGDQAEATFVNPLVESEETIELVRVDGEWKIATLETRPGG